MFFCKCNNEKQLFNHLLTILKKRTENSAATCVSSLYLSFSTYYTVVLPVNQITSFYYSIAALKHQYLLLLKFNLHPETNDGEITYIILYIWKGDQRASVAGRTPIVYHHLNAVLDPSLTENPSAFQISSFLNNSAHTGRIALGAP